MKSKLRLINKSDNVIKTYSDPRDIATFLLGRNVNNYIIVKSDDLGDRVVVFLMPDWHTMVEAMERQ